MEHRGFNSNDRVQQVDWLRNEAENILLFDMDGSASAEDLVDFWKDQSGELPKWFDSSDEKLLRRYVAEAHQ